MNCSPPDSSVHGDSTGKNTGVGCHALLGIFPTQGLNPGLPHWRWIFLSFEPPGKPKNTGVGSLSLLQGNFLTQESNQDLQHCRQILYHWATREALIMIMSCFHYLSLSLIPSQKVMGYSPKEWKPIYNHCKDKMHQICVTLDFLQLLIEPQFFTFW